MKTFLFLLLLIPASATFSQKAYPVPPAAAERLFYIQHNSNTNTYVYDANFLKRGVFVEDMPVKIYRIMFAEGGEKRELTFSQLKFAYGLNTTLLSSNSYEMSLVAYPKQKMYLKSDHKGKAYVETTVNGKKMILNKMFLQSAPGSSGFSIKMQYILFYGRDSAGKNIVEKFIP